MHDVHYAPNASNMSFPVNATVHSNYNIMDRPLDAYTGTMTSQGPPGIQFLRSLDIGCLISSKYQEHINTSFSIKSKSG
jgi:hypothetical protein